MNGAQAIEYDIFYCADAGGGRLAMIEPKLLAEANLDTDTLTCEAVRAIPVNHDANAPEYPVELPDVLALVPPDVAQQIHLKTTETGPSKLCFPY